MRRVIEFAVLDVLPGDDDVLPRLGVPAGATIPHRTRSLLDEAVRRLAERAQPRAVMQPVSAAQFARIYGGEGRNAPDTPLDAIYPRADALALFVVTIGQHLEDDVGALFRAGDAALGVVLDSYASGAANKTVDALAKRFRASVADDGGGSASQISVLPYSPGYCGWHLTGQRTLFEAVRPIEIGVTLQPSCLMMPIKSVSGVLVAGDAGVHRFRPAFEFCRECRTHDCVPRMRSTMAARA